VDDDVYYGIAIDAAAFLAFAAHSRWANDHFCASYDDQFYIYSTLYKNSISNLSYIE
jgi:hypothetical protein